jgi:hypothetical protein
VGVYGLNASRIFAASICDQGEPLSLVELACNWRSIQNLKKSKDVSWISSEMLIGGASICEKPTSVFIPRTRFIEIDISEMRDWVTEFILYKYKMYNRFRYETRPYRLDREYLGLSVRFESSDDALYYKMYWF